MTSVVSFSPIVRYSLGYSLHTKWIRQGHRVITLVLPDTANMGGAPEKPECMPVHSNEASCQ